MSTASSLPLIEPKESADRPWLDRIGISASLLCAIHCMAAPFLLLLLPTAGSVWSHPAVHWVLAAAVLPLALWVIFKGYRLHKSRLTLAAAVVGAVCIFAGLIAPMLYVHSLFTLNIPTFGFFHESLLPYAASASGDVCCPAAMYNAQAHTFDLNFPPGGLITLIGSLALVFAHVTNLIASRAYRKKHGIKGCGSDDCGCPA